MKIFQYSQFENSAKSDLKIPFSPDIIFLFVSPFYDKKEEFISNLSKKFPETIIAGNAFFDSSGIENPYNKNVEFTAVLLEEGKSKVAHVSMDDVYTSYEAGDQLSEKLNDELIKHVFLFSDGYNVRGADLLNGFRYSLVNNISITGNVTSPGDSFQGFVISDGKILKDHIVGIGLYGDYGSSVPGTIDRFEKLGQDILNRESIQDILMSMQAKPEPAFS